MVVCENNALRTAAAGAEGSPQLKANLVVSLSSGSVGHRISAHLLCYFYLALGDQRPRDRGTQQVHPLVQRVRPASISRGWFELSNSFPNSIWRLAISGRAIEVPSRYTPSYSEFALRNLDWANQAVEPLF